MLKRTSSELNFPGKNFSGSALCLCLYSVFTTDRKEKNCQPIFFCEARLVYDRSVFGRCRPHPVVTFLVQLEDVRLPSSGIKTFHQLSNHLKSTRLLLSANVQTAFTAIRVSRPCRTRIRLETCQLQHTHLPKSCLVLFNEGGAWSMFWYLMNIYHWKYWMSNKVFDIRSKPKVKIKIMSPYHSVQTSTQCWIWLQCVCWQQTVPNRYIKIEFDIGYFQWCLCMIFL